MFLENKCYIGNVGDSRAIMGFIGDDGKMQARALSIDHKPTLPCEKERLDKTAAVLLTEKQVRGFGDETKVYNLCICIYYIHRWRCYV